MKPLCLESEVIVDTIFEACQSDVVSPGLVLEDVQRKACITAVDQIVGVSKGGKIDKLFEATDSNGDGILIRSEVSDAFKALTLQRSSKPTCVTYYGKNDQTTKFVCNGKPKCTNDYYCSHCTCP